MLTPEVSSENKANMKCQKLQFQLWPLETGPKSESISYICILTFPNL